MSSQVTTEEYFQYGGAKSCLYLWQIKNFMQINKTRKMVEVGFI